MKFNTTGYQNTAIGRAALLNNTQGHDNTAIGHAAGGNLANGSYNLYINSPGGTATESSTTRIGDAQTRTFIAGIKGVPLTGATVVVDANGQLGVVASSARYKQEIEELESLDGKLARLRPVTYRYRSDPSVRQYGLIAEEVEKIFPELVVKDAGGKAESVQYHELIPMLLKQNQEQQGQIAQLAAENGALKAELGRRLERLEGQVQLMSGVASR